MHLSQKLKKVVEKTICFATWLIFLLFFNQAGLNFEKILQYLLCWMFFFRSDAQN